MFKKFVLVVAIPLFCAYTLRQMRGIVLYGTPSLSNEHLIYPFSIDKSMIDRPLAINATSSILTSTSFVFDSLSQTRGVFDTA